MKLSTVRKGEILFLTFFLLFLIKIPFLGAHTQKNVYTGLLEMAGNQRSNAPTYPLKKLEDGFDQKIHASNMEYLKSNPDILNQIRADLGEQDFQWHLKDFTQRLLYTPESSSEYAALYEAYCREVIEEVLDKLELKSPYTRIVTLTSETFPLENTEGVTAYIVHNLTVDYRARYEFSTDNSKTVAMELSGQYDSGEVGSYSSELIFGPGGQIHFVRDAYTVWQNNARNPYTALMTPVEETLHYLLREATESAIHAAIMERPDITTREAAAIVDEWISVEEAIVGGLVRRLLPPILENKVGPFPESLLSEDQATKEAFPKYEKLDRGIRLVNEMGYKACLELYLKSPGDVRALLL